MLNEFKMKNWFKFFKRVHVPEDPNGCWEWWDKAKKTKELS